MNMNYFIKSVIGGFILYVVILGVLIFLSKIEEDRFRKKYFDSLKETEWLKKISRQIFWVENRKRVYFNFNYLLTGYDREYLFWNTNINFLYRMFLSWFIFSIIIYLFYDWKTIAHLIDWNTFIIFSKKIYSFAKAYFSVFLIFVIVLTTMIFSSYKRVFEGILNDKKKDELRASLDLNCKLFIQFRKLYFELRKIIIENFDNYGKYNNSLINRIFEDIFADISFDGTNYSKGTKRPIRSLTHGGNYIDDKKILSIVGQLDEILKESLQHSNFYAPSIWSKYNTNIMEISSLIYDFDLIKVTSEFITNKKINDFIVGHKNEWRYFIELLCSNDDIDESQNNKLRECRKEIEKFVNRSVIETLWTMKSLNNYSNGVYDLLRIKNSSILEAFGKAKEIQ